MRAIGLCCRTTDSLGYEYKKGLQLIADPFLDTSPSEGTSPQRRLGLGLGSIFSTHRQNNLTLRATLRNRRKRILIIIQ